MACYELLHLELNIICLHPMCSHTLTLLTLLHSERPKLHRVLGVLSAIGLKSGQGWILTAHRGQLKTGQDGKGLLQSYLWCPNDLAIFKDRPGLTIIEVKFQIPSVGLIPVIQNSWSFCAFV